MSKTIESARRAQLTEERESLQRQLSELGDLDLDSGFADSSQVAAEQGEARALTDNLGAQLNEVERALVKLDDGTYGTCETCGEPINAPRLEAMPTARYCVDHA